MYELLAGLAKSALKVGDRPRSIVLGNARGKAKDVGQMVKREPVLVMLYRDGWCPFYNLEPHAFQRVPSEIKAADAALVAISLEKPGPFHNLSLSELDFYSWIIGLDASQSAGPGHEA